MPISKTASGRAKQMRLFPLLYKRGEITKAQFHRMMRELKRARAHDHGARKPKSEDDKFKDYIRRRREARRRKGKKK